MKPQFTPPVDGLWPRLVFGAVMVLLAASSLTSQAQNCIGIHFAGRQWSIGGNTPQSLAYTDTAGVVSQQNWNNVDPSGHDSGTTAQITGPNAGAISDNSGAATSLTLTYTAQGMWSVNQTAGLTGNQQLMNGYSDIESSANGGCSIGNISYAFYDVYVYISADGNGRTVGVSINGGTPYYLNTDAAGYNYSNPLLPGAATTQAAATNAHYFYFHNVSGANLQIDVTRFGNNVGMAGIQIVDVSGIVYPPSFAVQPAPEELYAGRTAQFKASATGTDPLIYHWQNNSVNLTDNGRISGSTTNILTITNVSAADDGNYDVVVTNIGGSTASSSVQLTVVTPVSAYETAVVSNNPVAYYRFNETGDSTSGSLPAYDYIGGDNGTYGSMAYDSFYGTFGPQPADGYPGFENGNGAVLFYSSYSASQITVPSWPMNTNAVTLTAWVYPLGTEAAHDGLIINRGANVDGLNYSGSTDAGGNYTLSYTWNNDGNTYGWNSGLVPPANQWSLVALVVTPTNAMIYIANTNGMAYAVHTYPHAVQSFSGPIEIGNDPSDTGGNRVFNGNMDEVAVFNQALSQDQVTALFSSASGLTNFAPVISVQPAPQAPYVHENARFSVGASGSQPLSYQWQVGTNGVYVNLTSGGRIAGATSATLTISNVSLSDPTNYQVMVTNTLGSVISSPASLTVTTNSYASAVLAGGPMAYYSFNETGDPAGGGLTAYDYAGGFNGIYGADVKNGNPNYGVAGPGAADGFPAFQTNNWAAQIIPNDSNGHVTVSPWNLNTNTVTLTGWVRPNGVPASWSGVIFCRGAGADAAGQPAGLNFSGSTDANGNRPLTYTWGGNIVGWNSQLAPPTNQWSFLALVVTPTNETIYLFNTNSLNRASAANTNEVLGFAGTTMIGGDPYDPSGRNFNGVIDEAAVFNRALSSDELVQLYSAGTGAGVGPQITMLTPSTVSGYPGFTTTFAASAIGSGPLSYQWYHGTNPLTNGGNLAGANTPFLTISNVMLSDAGNYTLVVTGAAGVSTSTVTTLNLGTPPGIPYQATVLAANPVAYWRLNETNGTTAHDSVGGHDGTYGSAMQLGAAGQETTGMFGVAADTAAASFTHNTTNSWVTVPALNLNNNEVTIMAWVYPTLRPDNWSGIFLISSPSRAGLTFRDNTPENTLGFMWNNGDFWYLGTSLNIPVNQWSLVALSLEPTDATLYVMNSSGTNAWSNTNTMNVLPWSGTALIGCDNGDVSRVFNGYINEVAVFDRTLTGAELGQLYSAAVTAQSPVAPLAIQIQKSGANLQLTWSQGVLLEATNVVGPWSTNSSAVSPYIVTPTGPQMFYRLQSQ